MFYVTFPYVVEKKGNRDIYLKVILNLEDILQKEDRNSNIIPCCRKSKQFIFGKIIQNTWKVVMTKKTQREEWITDDIWACIQVQKQKERRKSSLM